MSLGLTAAALVMVTPGPARALCLLVAAASPLLGHAVLRDRAPRPGVGRYRTSGTRRCRRVASPAERATPVTWVARAGTVWSARRLPH